MKNYTASTSEEADISCVHRHFSWWWLTDLLAHTFREHRCLLIKADAHITDKNHCCFPLVQLVSIESFLISLLLE